MEQKARIYTKGTNGVLPKYQLAVNEAAIKICKENPTLLFERDKLFQEARKKVRDYGYLFAKSASRSQEVQNPAL